METYDRPDSRTYCFGEHDFGAGGEALAIPVPTPVGGLGAFARFRVRDIEVSATETFTNTTTPGYVRVGTAGDADKYAELDLGTTADTNAIAASNQEDALKDADSLGLGVGSIGALTQLEVAFVAPTGGTPAGRGFVAITIDWF